MPGPIQTRVTLLFQQGNTGWSELYWRYGDPSLDFSLARANDLALVRAGMLCKSAEITAIRVSDETVYRDSLITVNTTGLYTGNPGWPDGDPYIYYLVRLEAGKLYRKPIHIRGLPRAVQTIPFLESGIADAWNVGYTYWSAVVLDAGLGWKMRHVSREADGDFAAPLQTIATINDAGHVGNPLYGPGYLGLQPGHLVHIYGSRKYPSPENPIRGQHRVTAVEAEGFRMDYTFLDDPKVYARELRVRRVRKGFFQINKAIQEQLKSLRTGRPFGQPVGRFVTR